MTLFRCVYKSSDVAYCATYRGNYLRKIIPQFKEEYDVSPNCVYIIKGEEQICIWAK